VVGPLSSIYENKYASLQSTARLLVRSTSRSGDQENHPAGGQCLGRAMNYWPRYPGDWARDTAHLSLAEQGAYVLLLDTYYATERPLPESLDSLCRIARAISADERAAVASNANQFFPIFPDGLRHSPRADREIAIARPKIDTARLNGRKGGRPKKNPEITQWVPGGLADRNPVETQWQSSPSPDGNGAFQAADLPY